MLKRISFLLAVIFSLTFVVPVSAQVPRCDGRFDSCSVQLLASTAITAATSAAGTAGSTISRMQRFREGLVMLDVTAVPAFGGQTLDVSVQTLVGGVWTDLIAFGQITTSSARRIARWTSRALPSTTEGSVQARGGPYTALSAGTVNEGMPISDSVRVVYYAPASTSAYTFSVTGWFRE